MSIDSHIYIGPYVEVQVKIVSTKVDLCKNKDNCPNPKSGFCSECGVSATYRFKNQQIEEPQVDPYDLFEDELSPTHRMSSPPIKDGSKIYRYIPNLLLGSEPREFHPYEEYGDVHFDWTNVNVHEELYWFGKSYAKALNKLEKSYGKIELKWGYIQWCS